jgi:hypothetical protein
MTLSRAADPVPSRAAEAGCRGGLQRRAAAATQGRVGLPSKASGAVMQRVMSQALASSPGPPAHE